MSQILSTANDVSLRFKKVITEEIYTKNLDGDFERLLPGGGGGGSGEVPYYVKPTRIEFDATDGATLEQSADLNHDKLVIEKKSLSGGTDVYTNTVSDKLVELIRNTGTPTSSKLEHDKLTIQGSELTKEKIDMILPLPVYIEPTKIKFDGAIPMEMRYNNISFGKYGTSLNTITNSSVSIQYGNNGTALLSATSLIMDTPYTSPSEKTKVIINRGSVNVFDQYQIRGLTMNYDKLSLKDGLGTIIIDRDFIERVNKYLKVGNITNTAGADTSILYPDSLVINNKILTSELIQKLIDSTPTLLPSYLKTNNIILTSGFNTSTYNPTGVVINGKALTDDLIQKLIDIVPGIDTIPEYLKPNTVKIDNTALGYISQSNESTFSKNELITYSDELGTIRYTTKQSGALITVAIRNKSVGTVNKSVDINATGITISNDSDDGFTHTLTGPDIKKVNDLPIRKYYVSNGISGLNKFFSTVTCAKPTPGTLTTILISPGDHLFLLKNYGDAGSSTLSGLDFFKSYPPTTPPDYRLRLGSSLFLWFLIKKSAVDHNKYEIKSSICNSNPATAYTTYTTEQKADPHGITSNKFFSTPTYTIAGEECYLGCIGIHNPSAQLLDIDNILLSISIKAVESFSPGEILSSGTI